jgi:hypothetical protein
MAMRSSSYRLHCLERRSSDGLAVFEPLFLSRHRLFLGSRPGILPDILQREDDARVSPRVFSAMVFKRLLDGVKQRAQPE